MFHIRVRLCVILLLACYALPLAAQQPAAAAANVTVPPLVRFTGVLKDVNGKPLSGTVGVTFYLYKDSHDGAPLWMETQNVLPDRTGHYSVMLGSTNSQGLPADLFVNGEARWLGAQVQGQEEQPRVLLLSVPYALKAADAETIGGKPASAFMLATPQAEPGTLTTGLQRNGGITPAVIGGGTVNFIPIWKTGTKLGNSILFQGGVNVGVGTTTPNAKLEVGAAGEGSLALRLDSGPNSFLDITPTNSGGKFQTVFDTVNGRDIGFAGRTHNVGIGTTAPNFGKLQIYKTGGVPALTIDGGSPENNYHLDLVPFSPGSGVVDYTFVTKREDQGLSSNVLTLTQPTLSTSFCNGCVGVGTTTPNAKLEVGAAGEGSLALRLDSGPNAFLDITPTNTGGKFQTVFDPVNNRDIAFAGGTQNVGIGTTSPANKLDVVGGHISVGGSRALSCSRSCGAIGSISSGGISTYSTGSVAAPAGYSLTGCSAYWASSTACSTIQYPTTANITALDDGAGACHALGYNGSGSTLMSCACVTACELP